MAAVGREQCLWRKFLARNVHCPPAFDRQNKAFEVSSPFAVNLKAVDGIENKNNNDGTEYQLYVSLYDIAYKQFFGRQWVGPSMASRSSVGQKPRIQYNQTIYFHTGIHDVNIALVVELVAVTLGEKRQQKRVSCGWGILRMFKYEGEMPDTSKPGAPSVYTMDIYHGSPRALYFLEDPIESSQFLKPSGCQVTYTLQTHRALLKAVHLIPENIILGGNDTIPGLLSAQQDPSNTDCLKKPRVLKSMSCQLDRLIITLPPNIDKFEEELCQYLTEDKNSRERHSADGSTVSIVERRLHVGVHNGWSYVDKPQTIHLVTESSGVNPRKVGMSPTMRRSSKFTHQRTPSGSSGVSSNSATTHLTTRNSVQINDLVEDPMLSLVFSLEYVIGEPLHKEDRKMASNMARTHTRNVTIRWAAWNPFLDFITPDVSISLVGGPGVMPDDTLVYRVPPTDMQDQTLAKAAPGMISFYWSDMRKGGDYLGLPPGSTHLSSFDDGAEQLLDVSHGKPPIPVNKGSPIDGSRRPSLAVPRSSMGDISNVASQSVAMLSPRAPGGPPELLVPQTAGMAYAQPQGYAHLGSTPRVVGQPGMTAGMAHPAMGYHMGYPAMYQPGPIAYPVEIGHLREPPSSQVGVAGPDLNELPFTPVHAPIVLTGPTVSGHGLSRAAYARLYSVGFPTILDRNGDPPEVIDPQAHISVDLAKEEVDPLSCNEITFQFLAFSKMLSYQPSGPASQSGTVFFTFNFYRYPQLTTERLLLSKPQSEMTSDPSSMPFVLQRLEKDGSVEKGPPGYQIRYFVDPGFLKPGERSLFLQNLSQQTLHIDVWDGDSLLLIGSASVELKCLLRRGFEAVQTTYELDVVAMEYEDDLAPNMTGDLHRGGSVRPVGVNTLVKGRLHLRMANVGHYPDMKATKQVQLVGGSKTNVLVSETAGKSAYIGGSLTAGTGTGTDLKKNKVNRAQHLVENNREVASLVASQRGNLGRTEKMKREGDAERQRKLARMQAVRTMTKENLEEKPLTILGAKQEKAERMRDLKTIDFYRQQTKRDGILTMLSENMTTEHTIYPSFGSTEFFEFMLRNPYNVQHTVVVECNDPELRVITNTREWRHFKQLHQVNTPIEEGMFSKSAQEKQLPEIFLRPKETVNIPFKFVMFSADQSVQPQGPLDPFNKERNERNTQKDKSSLGETGSALSRLIKVYFKSEDNKPLSVLKLKVEPQPHIIDQTFRFHHPEQAFLKKSIRLPPFHALPGAPVGGPDSQKVFVRCSDPNVICESKKTQAGEPQDVFLKVACGPSPQVKKFFIAIYTDFYLTKPSQLWQFYIHALQRVDVSCVEGQTNRFSLILRGTQSSRLVRCFSSHPNEMVLQPAEPFMLAASTVHELSVAVRPMRVGNKFFYINVVDTEYHQLLRTWLVCVNCRAPMISRAFELNLPIGGGKGSNKRITFTNPYPYKKSFLLRSNRDDLLQFKDTRLEIDAGATQNIGLRFAPCMCPGATEILIFINDEEEKNEETFCIKATYSTD